MSKTAHWQGSQHMPSKSPPCVVRASSACPPLAQIARHAAGPTRPGLAAREARSTRRRMTKQRTHDQACAQQVVPGARVCRQRVPAARVGREARGRHDSACPGGPSDEQGASEDDQATRSARAPSLRTRRRCAATPGRARLDRPRWGGWARAENRQAWRRPDDLGHGLAVSSAWRPRCHWCSRLASTGGARLYGPSPGPCLAQLVRSRLPSAPPSSRRRPTALDGSKSWQNRGFVELN